MNNNTDNPKQTEELWDKLKLQTKTTATSLKLWFVALPKNQTLQCITKVFCVGVTTVFAVKLLTTIQTLLPVVVTVYLIKMLYQNGYKLDNRTSEFLIKHEFIKSAPVGNQEPKLTFSDTDTTGISNWSLGKYTGEYQVIGANNYQTTQILVRCDQNNKQIQCKVEDLREAIKELIKNQ